MSEPSAPSRDGLVHSPDRVADLVAIQQLAIAYAHAVDDGDWARWEVLFLADAHVDYTSAGGIEGSPAELAAWMPGALSVFEFCLHTTSMHDIAFTGADSATGRVHVFNRNGVTWEGRAELVDVGAVYHDTYRRVDDGWRIASRVEHTIYITGGAFAGIVRAAATNPGTGRTPPFG